MECGGSAMEEPRLAWTWILDKLVDAPKLGVGTINDMASFRVKDIEKPRYWSLLERLALRNLKEMVVTNQIHYDSIPLVKELTRQGSGAATNGASSVNQRFNRELVLRVQTEAVLSVLRGDVKEDEERDWARYESELERVFGEAEEDNRLLDRRRELSALLKPKNQKPATLADYFEKFSLSKLRHDLSSFIEEKQKPFKTMFIDQLSRDFLDSNGTPFPLESTKGDANGNQDRVGNINVESLQLMTCTQSKEDMDLEEVGQNPILVEIDELHDMNGTEHRNVVPGNVSGKKRVRRKVRPIQDDIGDDEPEEAREGNEGTKKARKSPTSVINPSKSVLHQSISVKAISKSGPRNGISRVKHEVEPVEELPLLRKGDEAMSAPRNIGSDVVRRCSPLVHASMNMRGTKTDPREPSPANKYVIISDVESDAETQVVKRLSISDEDDPTENCEDVGHLKKADQSLLENSSDRGHSERNVPIAVVRKETIIVQSERVGMLDGRIEALTASPQAEISQQGGSEKIVIKNGSTSQDSQDIYKVNLRQVGEDGYEEYCHICESGGKLYCCSGCPISMHRMCIETLGIRLPPKDERWYCPVCVSKETARQAAEAERVAAAAKEKLLAFQEISKRCRKQVKAFKQSSLGVNSLQPEELDRNSKPQQRSPDKPKVSKAQQRSSEEPETSKAQQRSPEERKPSKSQQRSPEEPETSKAQQRSPEERKPSKSQQGSPEEPKHIEGRHVPDSRKASPIQASIIKRALQTLKQLNEDLENTDGSAEPASDPAAGREEVGAGGDYEDPNDDRVEYINQIPFSGRRKITGMRRKRLPWKKEEEKALMEGVKRFSNNGVWGFQWKRILEFGQGRFDPSRTDVDLKDKWRNLVKGVS